MANILKSSQVPIVSQGQRGNIRIVIPDYLSPSQDTALSPRFLTKTVQREKQAQGLYSAQSTGRPKQKPVPPSLPTAQARLKASQVTLALEEAVEARKTMPLTPNVPRTPLRAKRKKQREEVIVEEGEGGSIQQSPGMQASLSTYQFHNFLTQFNRLTQRQRLLRRLRLVDQNTSRENTIRSLSSTGKAHRTAPKSTTAHSSFFQSRSTAHRTTSGNYSLASYQEFSEELLNARRRIFSAETSPIPPDDVSEGEEGGGFDRAETPAPAPVRSKESQTGFYETKEPVVQKQLPPPQVVPLQRPSPPRTPVLKKRARQRGGDELQPSPRMQTLELKVEELLRQSKNSELSPKEGSELRQIFSNAMLKYGKYIKANSPQKRASKFRQAPLRQSIEMPRTPSSPVRRKYLPQTSCALMQETALSRNNIQGELSRETVLQFLDSPTGHSTTVRAGFSSHALISPEISCQNLPPNTSPERKVTNPLYGDTEHSEPPMTPVEDLRAGHKRINSMVEGLSQGGGPSDDAVTTTLFRTPRQTIVWNMSSHKMQRLQRASNPCVRPLKKVVITRPVAKEVAVQGRGGGQQVFRWRPTKLRNTEHIGGGFRIGTGTGSSNGAGHNPLRQELATIALGALTSSTRKGGSILGMPHSDMRPERLYSLLLSKPHHKHKS